MTEETFQKGLSICQEIGQLKTIILKMQHGGTECLDISIIKDMNNKNLTTCALGYIYDNYYYYLLDKVFRLILSEHEARLKECESFFKDL